MVKSFNLLFKLLTNGLKGILHEGVVWHRHKYEANVIHELLNLVVLVILQFLFDAGESWRILIDIVKIVDSKPRQFLHI